MIGSETIRSEQTLQKKKRTHSRYSRSQPHSPLCIRCHDTSWTSPRATAPSRIRIFLRLQNRGKRGRAQPQATCAHIWIFSKALFQTPSPTLCKENPNRVNCSPPFCGYLYIPLSVHSPFALRHILLISSIHTLPSTLLLEFLHAWDKNGPSLTEGSVQQPFYMRETLS